MYTYISTITISILAFQVLLVLFLQALLPLKKAYFAYWVYLLVSLSKAMATHFFYLEPIGGWLTKEVITFINEFSNFLILISLSLFFGGTLALKGVFPRTERFVRKIDLNKTICVFLGLYLLDYYFFRSHPRSAVLFVMLMISTSYLVGYAIKKRKEVRAFEWFIITGGMLVSFIGIFSLIFILSNKNAGFNFNVVYGLYLPMSILETLLFTLSLIYQAYDAVVQNARLANVYRDSELRALRKELDPHFIQNTFDIIAGRISESNKEESIKVISNVSKYMRLVLEKSQKVEVTLDAELDYLQEYLKMQTLINPGLFEYSIEMDEEVESFAIKMPSMILQPIVENCIKHGFAKIQSGGKITVSIQQRDSFFSVEIKDNGSGLNSSQSMQKDSQGILITTKRLHLMYNNTYNNVSVALQNNRNEAGTIFSISLYLYV